MNRKLKNIILSPMNLIYKINPKFELQLMFLLKERYKLNLDNPKTYNEKLNWMKLYYKNDLIPKCVDKYEVRNYIKDCGCEELLPKLLWEGFNANEMPFDDLPNQFVIKVTHGSGNNIICKNKSELNFNKVERMLTAWLKEEYIPCYGEWFYGIVKPRIIVEEFLTDNGVDSPKDYKMYCFNNINGDHGVGFTSVDTERFTSHKKTIYDGNWKILNDVTVGFPNDTVNICARPNLYEDMIKYALKLSKNFPHVRVDFYIVNNKIYFGELTFTNCAGFAKIKPYSFNERVGSWIDISKV